MQLNGVGNPVFVKELHGNASFNGGSNASSELSIIALRRATALQRYKEIQE